MTRLAWVYRPHPLAILNSGGFTTWDAKRRLLWGHSGDGGGNAFVAYSLDGANPNGTVGCWAEFHPSKLPGEANHNAMQIHPGTDMIVVAIHTRDSLAVIDPKKPSAPVAPVVSLGTKPCIQNYAALEYSVANESLVYYSAADGATVYGIDWDGDAHWYVLSQHASLNPVADAITQTSYHVNQMHTFGRFRVAHFEDVDLAVLVRHVDTPVYAMCLDR